MSDFKHKPDSGSLFRNDKKEKDSHPDYKGDGLINGKEVWISAWLNETKSGQKYFGMKFKEKEAVHEQGMGKVQETISPEKQAYIEDDDIPF